MIDGCCYIEEALIKDKKTGLYTKVVYGLVNSRGIVYLHGKPFGSFVDAAYYNPLSLRETREEALEDAFNTDQNYNDRVPRTNL